MSQQQPNDEQLKANLYNRQLYVYGAETQKKYGATNVLLVGLGGAGCEVAKNLILTGVKSVTLLDPRPVQWSDLSTMFYATPADIGKPRASVLQPRLGELNRFVSVTVAPADVSVEAVPESYYASHQVVVYCNLPTTSLVAANTSARKHGCKFIALETAGVAGSVFVDGGNEFTIVDGNGEECKTCFVLGVFPDGTVALHTDKRHECGIDDVVYFQGIQKPAAMNTAPGAAQPNLFTVTDVKDPFSLTIKLPDGLGTDFLAGPSAYMYTAKKQQQIKFSSLAESLKAPEHVFVSDVENKWMSGPAVLDCFRAYHQYLATGGSTTTAVASDALTRAAEEVGVTETASRELLKVIGPAMNGNINPMACFFGGIVAQEVLKLCSGKFTPIQQWLCMDFRELITCLPNNNSINRTPLNSRYDGLILVLGQDLQRTLSSKSVFIVGAGALGCELIKNAALLGLGTSGEGKIIITDMDTIEMSNLSRQFLFRTQHIGLSKSLVASEAAKSINSEIRITHLTEKVAPETANIFNEKFWATIDLVCNALDNVAARRYVDSQCVSFKRPLFESGTLGPSCNVQVVIPYLTNCYSNTYDPPEATVPLCTLKNFPTQIDHTIQWARDAFEKHFSGIPNDVNAFLESPEGFIEALNRDANNKTRTIQTVSEALRQHPRSLHDAIVQARQLFDELFTNSTKQLLHNLPVDGVDSEGNKIWTGAKKPPVPPSFDAADDLHMSFIRPATALIARVNKVPNAAADLDAMTQDELRRVAASAPEKPFIPQKVQFATSEKQTTEEAAATGSDEAQLPDRSSVQDCGMVSESFEKDDDFNSHIDFITATSNIRAKSYSIPIVDRDRTKLIAGKIIPAMVTTTSYVTGAVCAELLKYVAGEKTRENYRDLTTNLAICSFVWGEPATYPRVTYTVDPDTNETIQFGMWDTIDVNEGKDITVNELVKLIENKYKLDIFMISSTAGAMLFSQFGANKARFQKPVGEVLQELKVPLKPGMSVVELVVSGSYGDVDVDQFPAVRYRFRDF